MVSVKICDPSFRASDARIAWSKKIQTCAPLPGARALQRGWNAQTTASFPKCLRVLSPTFLVEIDGQEKTGFVLKHRIDAHDEILALIILTREVPPDCLIGDGEKALMRTIATFDPGFLANTLNPFVAADRLIACLARLSAFKPAWIDVLAPTKESTEQGDFRFRRRPMIDRVVEPAGSCMVRRSSGLP
jgi:hypothetical protein